MTLTAHIYAFSGIITFIFKDFNKMHKFHNWGVCAQI